MSGSYPIYHGSEYEENDVDTEIAVPVAALGESRDEFQYKALPTIPTATTMRFSGSGSYENYAPAMEKLAL